MCVSELQNSAAGGGQNGHQFQEVILQDLVAEAIEPSEQEIRKLEVPRQ